MAEINKKTKRVAIALIEDHRGHLLMGYRKEEKAWAFPGGHLEIDEDPYIGMDRELEEETSLSVEDMQLVKVHYNKEKKILLYLFKITPNPRQCPDPSNDPDDEFEIVDYMDPIDVVDSLHIPIKDNIALQYWINS